MDALRVINASDLVERLFEMQCDRRYPIQTNSRGNYKFSCCDRAVDKCRIVSGQRLNAAQAFPVSCQQYGLVDVSLDQTAYPSHMGV